MERGEIQKGRTFSQNAIDELTREVNLFVLQSVAEDWERTNTPPTHLRVALKVDVS